MLLEIKPVEKTEKTKKEDKKTPISEMGIQEVSVLHEKYLRQLDDNSEDIYSLVGQIRPNLTDEEVEVLLYGCVFENGECYVLKNENDEKLNTLNIVFGQNAFRGLFSIENLSSLGLGVEKTELDGQKVRIPLKHWRVSVQLDELGKRCYWLLHTGMQLQKTDKRIKELETPKKEDKGETSLEDFLPSSSSSLEDEKDLKKKARGRKKRK